MRGNGNPADRNPNSNKNINQQNMPYMPAMPGNMPPHQANLGPGPNKYSAPSNFPPGAPMGGHG